VKFVYYYEILDFVLSFQNLWNGLQNKGLKNKKLFIPNRNEVEKQWS